MRQNSCICSIFIYIYHKVAALCHIFQVVAIVMGHLFLTMATSYFLETLVFLIVVVVHLGENLIFAKEILVYCKLNSLYDSVMDSAMLSSQSEDQHTVLAERGRT